MKRREFLQFSLAATALANAGLIAGVAERPEALSLATLRDVVGETQECFAG